MIIICFILVIIHPLQFFHVIILLEFAPKFLYFQFKLLMMLRLLLVADKQFAYISILS
uniref:Uncharacterized protein n=1 Tax=Rhizophora mucronata TaxID=61149 RepID=A0A2P2PSZ2_RHIMU